MRLQGHTTVWETHIAVVRARGISRGYQRLRKWWEAHKAAREQARLASLTASWDAQHETVRPLRAEAAAAMAATHSALPAPTMLYGLSV